ncbi:uncharacterized protein SPPG_05623 [Spizellomyces punctatus DAOM BR117]|uniref:Thioesterase n=1 Tax=Spizellomyces punctatus (strain DAOM BR117) TaxID=645134 RepID=A0A0L0HEH8_SPIPD|nr:uncharacterized protein SPPG_05623 [Spizellomyces punctatus DAOM BR117]KNC99379.1 hypothetical protein SPPG_05623 [Spizellomyces punctatus DAOM BR117]|eukprot:XP_016607419.1 hypothetical protein SPPG_05623 [Spizellomyces punctatus DAOM BR117]
MAGANQAIVQRRLVVLGIGILFLILGRKIYTRPRLLAFALLLFNIRSLPFAHHLRLSKHIVQAGLRRRWRPAATIWAPQYLTYRVWPDDMDWNLHMNNSTYNKHLDYARTDWAIAILGLDFNRKVMIMVGGVQSFFMRELGPLQKYAIESTLLGYDEKWIYVQHRFISTTPHKPSTVHCIAISKLVLKEPNGKTLPFGQALHIIGCAEAMSPHNEERRLRGMAIMRGFVDGEQMLLLEGRL